MVTKQIWDQIQHDFWERFWNMFAASVLRQSRHVIRIPVTHHIRSQIREELKW